MLCALRSCNCVGGLTNEQHTNKFISRPVSYVEIPVGVGCAK